MKSRDAGDDGGVALGCDGSGGVATPRLVEADGDRACGSVRRGAVALQAQDNGHKGLMPVISA